MQVSTWKPTPDRYQTFLYLKSCDSIQSYWTIITQNVKSAVKKTRVSYQAPLERLIDQEGIQVVFNLYVQPEVQNHCCVVGFDWN